MSASFPRLGKFQSSFIQISFLTFFSLLSFWRSCNTSGKHLMLPQSSLCYLHFFTTLIWWVLLSCLLSSVSPNLLLNPTNVFSSSVTILFSSVTSVWNFLTFSNLFDKVLTVFIHSSSECREHFYDYHFELFIRLITYLYFIKIFLRFYLVHLEHASLFLHFAWPSVSSYALDKTAASASPAGLALYRRQTLSFSPALILLVVSQHHCDYPSSLFYF